jgi:hypothetical protein
VINGEAQCVLLSSEIEEPNPSEAGSEAGMEAGSEAGIQAGDESGTEMSAGFMTPMPTAGSMINNGNMDMDSSSAEPAGCDQAPKHSNLLWMLILLLIGQFQRLRLRVLV